MKKSVYILLFVILVGFGAFLLLNRSSLSLPTSPQEQSTPTPVVTSAETPGELTVKVHFVLLEDNGREGKKIGCNDSLVSVNQDVEPGEKTIKRALEILLSYKDQTIEGTNYYNALANSSITVSNVSLTGSEAKVYLDGQLVLGGVCDSPRVEEQLRAAVLQFSSIQKVDIFLNNEPLRDALSQQ